MLRRMLCVQGPTIPGPSMTQVSVPPLLFFLKKKKQTIDISRCKASTPAVIVRED